ncbi:MAG TPA: LPS export ABC transporter periplasmic protein LptC [Nitrospirota bacterium]|nr:LPS export ABC transporter periplasmic protein LptC [Nitrospirota bacterium]
MKVNRTLVKLLLIFLIFGVSVYSGYQLIRETKEITIPSLLPPKPGVRLLMSMEGFRFAQSESGVISWSMNARNAELFENKEAQLNDVEIDFKNPNGKEATLFGDNGTMDTTSGNASIRRVSQDVRIATTDDYLLTTSSLFWKAGERLVWTPDPFKLLGIKIYLEGVGITANVDLHTVKVKDNVKAVLQE